MAKLIGYVNSLKKLENGTSVFDLAYGVKQMDKKEDGSASYKTTWIKVTTTDEVNEKDKVAVEGKLSAEFWTQDGKEKSRPVIVAKTISTDTEQLGNEVEVRGYVHSVKAFENGGCAFSLSYGIKTGVKTADGKDEYKNCFIKVISPKTTLEDRSHVSVKGFFSGDHWESEGKEKTLVTIIGMEITAL